MLINTEKIWGLTKFLKGDASMVNGSCKGLTGDISVFSGCCSRISGSLSYYRYITKDLNRFQEIIKKYNLIKISISYPCTRSVMKTDFYASEKDLPLPAISPPYALIMFLRYSHGKRDNHAVTITDYTKYSIEELEKLLEENLKPKIK